MFSDVGRETAQGNYDRAQRILEAGAQWDDDLRGAASEINQLDRERAGAKPMTLENVQDTISGYARDLEKISKEKGGRISDLESAMALDNIVGDISEPGIEGIDNALDYLEGTLKSKNNTADSIPPEDRAAFLKDWQEKRAMRDALFQEKQKRIEQQKQSKQTTKEISEGRASALRNLENLYAQADVPEDTPSRQEFLAKASRMSPEELHFLDTALKKAAVEFGRTRDPKLLDARLADLTTKSFKPEDVVKRRKEEDQRKIEEIRKTLGLPEQQPAEQEEKKEQLPQDSRTLNRYFIDTFRKFEGISLDQFKQDFTLEAEQKFQAWAKQHIDTLVKEKPHGARYPDTVASVLGNSPVVFQSIASLKEGRTVYYDELLNMPFSEAAKKYLNIDLPEDYFEHFSKK